MIVLVRYNQHLFKNTINLTKNMRVSFKKQKYKNSKTLGDTNNEIIRNYRQEPLTNIDSYRDSIVKYLYS